MIASERKCVWFRGQWVCGYREDESTLHKPAEGCKEDGDRCVTPYMHHTFRPEVTDGSRTRLQSRRMDA